MKISERKKMDNNDYTIVQSFSDLLTKNELSELEYQNADFYIRLSKTQSVSTPVITTLPVQKEEKVPEAEKEQKNTPKKYITSPMVGIVYLSKDPNSPTFVKTGEQVSKETVVCLIEAMKTFNSIKSEQVGKIVSVLVENGQPVEYGQPLFEVE